MIGAESELDGAVKEGWAQNLPDDKLKEWKEEGMKLEPELKAEIERVFEAEYWGLYRKVSKCLEDRGIP